MFCQRERRLWKPVAEAQPGEEKPSTWVTSFLLCYVWEHCSCGIQTHSSGWWGEMKGDCTRGCLLCTLCKPFTMRASISAEHETHADILSFPWPIVADFSPPKRVSFDLVVNHYGQMVGLVFFVFCFFFNSSTVDLQCCVHFCCTAKWLLYMYIHILFHTLFRLLSQDIEYSSLCYTVGPCLSILYNSFDFFLML